MPSCLDIVVDTREQTPWHFPEGSARVVLGTLPTGDYALAGDRGFAVERKSLDDYVSSVVHHWGRFSREIERMDGWPAKVVVVEATLSDIVHHRYLAPLVKPVLVMKRTAQLTMRGVSVLFAEDRDMAAAMAWLVLKERNAEFSA